MLGWAPRLSASEVDLQAAPLLGEHTEQVLVAELGLDTSAIAALRDRGVFGTQ
jgi:crotonobetainyl-CoA:carnitine CoA-transferase CaiB-like acyl-CoA transferase